MGDVRRPGQAAAGDLLLHPSALLALALLAANDHALKGAYPGVVTGKLSDVAGMVFFPMLLVAGWELGQTALRRWRGPSARVAAAAVLVTGAAFALVKTLPAAALVFGWGLGVALWLIAIPVSLLGGHGLPLFWPSPVVADPTDLLALPALVLPLVLGRRRAATEAVPSLGSAAGTRSAVAS